MPRVKTERWDPIGKARGERRSPRIRSDVSDPQRVVAILGDVPGVGISGIQPPRPFSSGITGSIGDSPDSVPPAERTRVQRPRSPERSHLGLARSSRLEGRSLKVPRRTRTGVVIHADRRCTTDPSPTPPAIDARRRSLRFPPDEPQTIESSGYPHRRPSLLNLEFSPGALRRCGCVADPFDPATTFRMTKDDHQ